MWLLDTIHKLATAHFLSSACISSLYIRDMIKRGKLPSTFDCVSNCPPSTSAWKSHSHLELDMTQTELLISILHPSKTPNPPLHCLLHLTDSYFIFPVVHVKDRKMKQKQKALKLFSNPSILSCCSSYPSVKSCTCTFQVLQCCPNFLLLSLHLPLPIPLILTSV